MSIRKEARTTRCSTSLNVRKKLEPLLDDYRTLALYLAHTDSTESIMLLLIGIELSLEKRPSVLIRLHQRLCRLRRDREREELLRG